MTPERFFSARTGSSRLKKMGDAVQVTIATSTIAALMAGVIMPRLNAMAAAAMINDRRDESSTPAARDSRHENSERKQSAGINFTR